MSFPKTAHWQPALEGDGYVTDLADIGQCIETILTTPKGSQPLRPDFGSDIYRYIDYPINTARPHLVRETVEAIKKWEPRVTVKRVQITVKGDSQLVITPICVLASGVEVSFEVRP
ncbi:MAG: GPW/gp25 family protein [Candidatus Sericytochromatia bacterium]|nr:GPW/gp25 family protein [Candidatus Sericytochromatia bacterium]